MPIATLELLAPAKNLTIGKIAIDHGADAVYIGAPSFGARKSAGNSLADIAELVNYAHRFAARVYVTVNTIVYDAELQEVFTLLNNLKSVNVDAVLVQDMAVMEMCKRIGLPIHASTQTDNRTAEKVSWLYQQGFQRVVLARELSLGDIKEIHEAVPEVELEAFVHGALCVSYSGVCYASQHCFNRSANRGECAQFCRLPFRLEDETGRVIFPASSGDMGGSWAHLLSLKDMNRLHHLSALAAVGVRSFKIEGRLKDEFYVKNVVAAYSQALDSLVTANPDKYLRASLGKTEHKFTPNLQKTFNRGYTTYGLHGREQGVWSPRTPKALGEMVGHVKELKGRSFTVSSTHTFANGDGLCYFNATGELKGFRVNRAENNRLYPLQMPHDLRSGMTLYRNQDVAFERLLMGNSAQRNIPVSLILKPTASGVSLTIQVVGYEQILAVTVDALIECQQAQKPQSENMRTQLSKLGGTPYLAQKISLQDDVAQLFVPSSVLATLRRAAVEKLIEKQEAIYSQHVDNDGHAAGLVAQPVSFYCDHQYQYNIANAEARKLYVAQGLLQPQMAYELSAAGNDSDLIMQCRHCIRYELGQCIMKKNAASGKPSPIRQNLTPAAKLFLRSSDGARYRLEFDCKHCQMNVYAEQ